MTADDLAARTTTRAVVWERAADGPMLALALVSIPLLLLEDLGRGAVAQAAVVANWAIWVAFAVDLVVRVWFARGRRMRYLARHWYDVGIVVLSIVPYFLPLRALRSVRALRILRAARVIVFAARLWHAALRIWGTLTGRTLLVLLPGVVAAGSAGVWMVERHSNGAIDHYGDAAWWAITTVSTVGYGDIAPVTTEGRAIAVVLMLTGIALFGVITANVAATLTKQRHSVEDLATRIDQLQATINELNQRHNSTTTTTEHPTPTSGR